MKLKNLIPHFYIYVPPCPKCRSHRTGRIIKKPITDVYYIERDSYKAGELIRFSEKKPSKNAFCENCGYEWSAKIVTKILSTEQVEREKAARRTEQRYLDYIQNTKKPGTFTENKFGKIYEPKTKSGDIPADIRVMYIDEELLNKLRKE